MTDLPVEIDVVDAAAYDATAAGRALLAIVEPLYGGTAVAAALDAGWGSVELADDATGDVPIPLVSFEQRPPADADRCRVRSSDLRATLDLVSGAARDGDDDDITVLAGPAFARPFASTAARVAGAGAIDRIVFVVASSAREVADDTRPHERAAADGWWAAGALIRVLLEELDVRDARLTDRAGISVTLATGAEEPTPRLASGVRYERHLAAGGSADDVRVAGAFDSIGAVPVVTREADAYVACPWLVPAS